MTIYGFGLYGMGGAVTDPGEILFSHRVRQLGVNIIGSPYNDYDIKIIVEAIKAIPHTDKILLWGSSLGANNIPYIASLVPNHTIDGMWGFQASEYGMHCPITANVKFAHEVYNSTVIQTGGLGSYRWVKAPQNQVTNLYLSDRHDMHPGETEATQEMFLAEMRRVILHAS